MIEAPARLDGTLRFIRYAFMPNRLGYCGGDDNRLLFEHAAAGSSDPALVPLLRQFTGAMPYLRLIASSNGIADPFDERVVEAYWLGNRLLDGVDVRRLYDALRERVDRHLSGRARELLLAKAPAGALPHHSFHVFDIHSRIGEQGHSLAVMDRCRVSWARVIAVEGPELVVERSPLVLREGRLAFGEAQRERALRQLDGAGFAESVAIGDWVSMHWNWACEVISPRQRAALERYSRHHLQMANATL